MRVNQIHKNIKQLDSCHEAGKEFQSTFDLKKKKEAKAKNHSDIQ